MGVEVPFHVRIKIQTHNIPTLMHPSAHGQTIVCLDEFFPQIPEKCIFTPADEHVQVSCLHGLKGSAVSVCVCAAPRQFEKLHLHPTWMLFGFVLGSPQ